MGVVGGGGFHHCNLNATHVLFGEESQVRRLFGFGNLFNLRFNSCISYVS